MAECAAFNALASAISGCGDLGIGNCALECINPLNWLPTKWLKKIDKLKKLKKLKKPKKIVPGPDEGVIYKVPGDKTPSGKPYIGSADDLAKRNKTARDGRDRTDAEIVDTYPKGDRDARRRAEQRAINDNGGVPDLDNKRNEIAPSKWKDHGIE